MRGRDGREQEEARGKRKKKKNENKTENWGSCEKEVQKTQIRGGKGKWEEKYSGTNYIDKKNKALASQKIVTYRCKRIIGQIRRESKADGLLSVKKNLMKKTHFYIHYILKYDDMNPKGLSPHLAVYCQSSLL